MNRLEELLFSTLIITLLIVINIGFAFTSVEQVDRRLSQLEIYMEVQDAFLSGRQPRLEAVDVYVSVVLNDTKVYEYGDPSLGVGGPIARYPIIVNGSMGELYCWVVEGG